MGARPSSALPRVASSPSVIMGTQSGTRVFDDASPFGKHSSKAETKRVRPQKLVAVMPAGSPLTPSPGVATTAASMGSGPVPKALEPLLQAPTGWSHVDAAS